MFDALDVGKTNVVFIHQMAEFLQTSRGHTVTDTQKQFMDELADPPSVGITSGSFRFFTSLASGWFPIFYTLGIKCFFQSFTLLVFQSFTPLVSSFQFFTLLASSLFPVVHTIGMKFISSRSHHWMKCCMMHVDFQFFTPLAWNLFPVFLHYWHQVYSQSFTPLAWSLFPVFHTIGIMFISSFSHHWHHVYLFFTPSASSIFQSRFSHHWHSSLSHHWH